MLSSQDVTRIKKDIATLEKGRDGCTDYGLQKLIDAWIQKAKEKLRASI
jgi:hypothetical protein